MKLVEYQDSPHFLEQGDIRRLRQFNGKLYEVSISIIFIAKAAVFNTNTEKDNR